MRGGASSLEVLPMEEFLLIVTLVTSLLGLAKAAVELAGALCARETRREDHADARSARHLDHK